MDNSDNNASTTFDSFFQEMYNTDTVPSVAVIRGGGYIDIRKGTVQTCNHVFRFNQCQEPSTVIPFKSRPVNGTKNPLPSYDRIVWLGAKFSMSFYHDTVEHLPRLTLIADFLNLPENEDVMVYTSGKLGASMEKMFGISNSRIVQPKSTPTSIYANTIYIPEPSPCLLPQPYALRAIQKTIHEKLRLPEEALVGKNIFNGSIVVIRRQSKREISNHDILLAALKEKLPEEHFIDYTNDNMPQEKFDQFKIFHTSKIVIAPHGAGLANLMAIQSQYITTGNDDNDKRKHFRPAVVEFLAHQGHFCLCFLALSSVLNLEYHAMKLDKIGQKRPDHLDTRNFLRGLARKLRYFFFPEEFDDFNLYSVDIPHAVNVVANIVKRQNEYLGIGEDT